MSCNFLSIENLEIKFVPKRTNICMKKSHNFNHINISTLHDESLKQFKEPKMHIVTRNYFNSESLL